MLQTHNQLRHDLMQPASVAVLMIEELKRRNQDESLRIPLELLDQALSDLAKLIEALE
jgi:hypothetical protein